jgi:hypothetical protein
MIDAPMIEMVKDRFDEMINILHQQRNMVSKGAETLRSSFYSLPLMFNVVNELKANKVGQIPKVQAITEGNPVIGKLYDAVEEGKGQSFEDILAVVKQNIQVNDKSMNNLEKIDKKLAEEFKKHRKWADTVNIDKIPATRDINLKDENEIELAHPLIEQTSKVFERSKVTFCICTNPYSNMAAIMEQVSFSSRKTDECIQAISSSISGGSGGVHHFFSRV